MAAQNQVIRRVAKEAYAATLAMWSRIDTRLRYNKNLEWLILLTMPNSGSTAVAKILMTAERSVSLTDKCEGEWLVPSVSDVHKRWDPDYNPSMQRLRARWMKRLRRYRPHNGAVVIEKSPPHMVRIDALREMLHPMKVHTAILVRHPLAVCESWHRRYGREQLAATSMPALRDVVSEYEYFRALGHCWAERWAFLARQRESSVCLLRYEDFVANTATAVSPLIAEVPLLADAALNAHIRVKDHCKQGLRDMNAEQIAALPNGCALAIAEGLGPVRDDLAELGYAI
jgi:hypothetical protein